MKVRPETLNGPHSQQDLQVEVMGVQVACGHVVDDPLTDRQRPPVQNPQGGLLVQSQVLTGINGI
ncbi:hypothetical protein EYF80_029319 [Liparis tanakae]|uniref:Uncharacterized protein n=1 Tax=Liparis tanakae TaxID=230148 RepID=A0A4Z2H3Q1_9TELE|nr:hypothetical protein EYF80_029319 [Liparis tanakae]